MLPVPLNSSKMTSSIREPMSTNAVKMMVRGTTFFDVTGGTEKPFGLVQSVRVHNSPDRILPECG